MYLYNRKIICVYVLMCVGLFVLMTFLLLLSVHISILTSYTTNWFSRDCVMCLGMS